MEQHGFVAGTLVHTDQGLVLIEQLKVGDLVLSKPESGKGEVAYKRVLKTFKSPEKHRIMRVGFDVPNLTHPFYKNMAANMTEEQILASVKLCENSCSEDDSDPYYVYCTENHPFWTEEQGWVAADMLEEGYIEDWSTFLNHQGIPLHGTYDYTYNTPLLKTCIKDLVMLCNRKSAEPREPLDLIDFSKNHPVLIKGIDAKKYPRFRISEPDAKNQPFIDISKIPNHPIHQELQDHGYIRTDTHPFYMEHGYTYEQIKDNKELCRALDKEYNLKIDPYYHATVYNIEVEDFKTYFVGESGVWVHNL